MQVEKLIASLLQKHGSVFIPNFGELSLNKENSKLDGNQMIPGNTLLFLNKNSDNNDGLMLHAFSKESGKSIDDCQEDFLKAINDIKSTIESGTSVEIPGYGLISKKGKEMNIESGKSNFLPNDFFGLKYIKVQNVNADLNLNEFVSVPVEDHFSINSIEHQKEQVLEPIIEKIENIDAQNEPKVEIQNTIEENTFIESEKILEQEIPSHTQNIFESEYVASPRHQNLPSKSRLKWGTVAGLVGIFLIASFITSWIYATLHCNKMMGLNPLWDHGCEKTPLTESKPTEVSTSDSSKDSKSVSAENAPVLAAQKPVSTSSNLSEVPTKIEKETPKEVVKPTPPVISAPPVVKTPSKPIAKVEKPAVEKPKEVKKIEKSVSKPIEKPTAKVEKPVLEKEKSKETVKVKSTEKPKEISKIVEKQSTEKAITEKPKVEKPVVEKPKVIKEAKVAVKPMPKVPMSAAYRKGITYLCFGTFRNPTVAKKLRTDLKAVGVLTETVEIDGTYRVVIPYTNRKFAETAAEDYPNTIIFE